MQILVACEESQAVTIELRKLGHEAYSCDLLDCSGGHPEWHIKGDVLYLLNGNCCFMTMNEEQHILDKKWDIIISNPPYTNKRKIVERCLSFEKPFALLLPLTWLNDSAPKQLFLEKDLQLLMFDKRIKYLNNGIIKDKITFSSAYYCYNILPKQIINEVLKEK